MDIIISDSSKINLFKKIRSKYIIQLIFTNVKKNKSLKIIKYNKNIQERLEIDVRDYEDDYLKIEIEVFPKKYRGKKEIKFINIFKGKNNPYYHIYFNDNYIETKKTSFIGTEHVSKIKIVLDKEFKYFDGLFKECTDIVKINFIKFNRTNIRRMAYMFNFCKKLKEINFTKFKTDNVEYMDYMFCECVSLEELDLSNFNTEKVKFMNGMFFHCRSLKKLNISNFKTDNLHRMSKMFYNCK